MRCLRKIISFAILSTAPVFGNLEIKSDEGLLKKGASLFSGNVSLQWPDKLKIFCDQAEHRKQEGYTLQSTVRPYLHIEFANFFASIKSKKAHLDESFEKALFIDDVNFTFQEFEFKGPSGECLMDEFYPQNFSIFSGKKDGCSLSYPLLTSLVFQRVNFDLNDKNALFFFPKGQFPFNGEEVLFTANWMKLEEGEPARLVLDGKIVIRMGKGSYISNGPTVIHFDPHTLEVQQFYAEGKSTFSWDNYTLSLDGLVQYDHETQSITMKTPDKNGLLLKYPFGEVKAARGEIRLINDEGNLRIEEINMIGNVFAVYGDPVLQYLLADSIKIRMFDRLATLYSNSHQRVLLHDQINRLEMSADKVNINWGDKLGDERIEGVGDVRFSFDQKEKGLMDALFRSR